MTGQPVVDVMVSPPAVVAAPSRPRLVQLGSDESAKFFGEVNGG